MAAVIDPPGKDCVTHASSGGLTGERLGEEEEAIAVGDGGPGDALDTGPAQAARTETTTAATVPLITAAVARLWGESFKIHVAKPPGVSTGRLDYHDIEDVRG